MPKNFIRLIAKETKLVANNFLKLSDNDFFPNCLNKKSKEFKAFYGNVL